MKHLNTCHLRRNQSSQHHIDNINNLAIALITNTNAESQEGEDQLINHTYDEIIEYTFDITKAPCMTANDIPAKKFTISLDPKLSYY